jgi:predicted phage terminase large subunit-like protein
MREIRPQPKQEQCLRSAADIVIFGGGAGGGKTWTMFLECLRHVVNNALFYAVFFRRTTVDIRNPGGLWDASMQLFPLTGARPRENALEWVWPRGGKVKMAHLEYENTVFSWQSTEVPLFIFDELTHFSRTMFFYMLSRNRSSCGVRPYMRATCNPDAESWVAVFIAWWIDPDTGYAIPERSGVIRWFCVINDQTFWADTRDECIRLYGDADLPDGHEDQVDPMSFTFILSMLSDNPIFTSKDPDYRRKLKALTRVQQERLLGGNWKIRPAPGLYFQRSQCRVIEPHEVRNVIRWVRFWDLAATVPSDTNPNPDGTAGVRMGLYDDGRVVIQHCESVRQRASDVRRLIKSTAQNDGVEVTIGIPQDPGQAGVDQVQSYAAMLLGYSLKSTRETGTKLVRAEPFSAYWQNGMVDVVRGHWNDHFFGVLEAFPDAKAKKDEVDAASNAFGMLVSSGNIFDSL